MCGIERKIDGQVVEPEAAPLREGKPLQLNIQGRRALVVGELVELQLRIAQGKVIDIQTGRPGLLGIADGVRRIIQETVCHETDFAHSIGSLAEVDVAGIETSLADGGRQHEARRFVLNFDF